MNLINSKAPQLLNIHQNCSKFEIRNKMSAQVLASSGQIPNVTIDVNRRSANYTPSVWSDHFLSYASMEVDIELEQHVQELKEEVMRMLIVPLKELSQQLFLIDDIQRLGVSYHFEFEIDQILQQHFHINSYDCDDEDLHTTALRFRLLRQQGYNVSCDMFNKFKDDDRKFKKSLVNDVMGLLSFYEATHLRVHGEDILEEALTFTTTHLESALSHPLSKHVTHALNQPLRKGLPRVEARYYMSIYSERNWHNETLLTFAKLDFNLLQQLHQKELCDITRWWKELDFATKLPFARDRVTEVYFCWTLSTYFEPEYNIARRMLCKVVNITSILDDIYDVYGTLDELYLFTEAIDRWDVSAMDSLPNYMKVCYKALLDIYNEIEEILANKGKLYQISYAREAMKKQVRAFFQEAKWFHHKYVPTLEEYLSVALVTCGYSMVTITSFLGMGDIITKDSFDWVLSKPKILKASQVVCRLMDDIAGYKFERKRGHVASAVECYMKQYSATEEEAIIELRKQVNNAWKDINEECLHPTTVPMPLLMRVLNLTRIMDVAYKEEDCFTQSGTLLEDYVASVLIESVPA